MRTEQENKSLEARAEQPAAGAEDVVVVRVGTPFFAKDDYIVFAAKPGETVEGAIDRAVEIAEQKTPEAAYDIKELLRSKDYQVRANKSPAKTSTKMSDVAHEETGEDGTKYQAVDIEILKTIRGGLYKLL